MSELGFEVEPKREIRDTESAEDKVWWTEHLLEAYYACCQWIDFENDGRASTVYALTDWVADRYNTVQKDPHDWWLEDRLGQIAYCEEIEFGKDELELMAREKGEANE